MRKIIVGAAVITASAGFAVVPASAHVGHQSCQGAGEFVSTVAQELRPLGQSFVKPAAHDGDHGVSAVIASAHGVLCEQTP
jgi:hypothetical protein